MHTAWWTRFSINARTDGQDQKRQRRPLCDLRPLGCGSPLPPAGGGRTHLQRLRSPGSLLCRGGGKRPGKGLPSGAGPRGEGPQAAGNQSLPGPVRDWSGPGQEGAGGGRVQPLQAHRPQPGGPSRRRRGAGEEQHPAGGSHRHRKDPAGPHHRQTPGRAFHHRGRHRAHRGRLCGRGRGEHPDPAAAGGRF